MDFTREPIIESVITPKEGCKLVVRSSKNAGQEEYFVDAVEMISFGSSFFFRSLERPKSFLVPANDYEILEVREARLVLKNVGLDKSIKIAGGREGLKSAKEAPSEREEIPEPSAAESETQELAETKVEGRLEKKRDRRRQSRRRRGREEIEGANGPMGDVAQEGRTVEDKIPLVPPVFEGKGAIVQMPVTSSSIISSLLPPPPMLISETIERYKENEIFRKAFFSKIEPALEEKTVIEKEVGESEEEKGSQWGNEGEKAPEALYEPVEEEAEIYRLRSSTSHEIPGAHTLSAEDSEEKFKNSEEE